MELFIHAGIKVNPYEYKGALGVVYSLKLFKFYITNDIHPTNSAHGSLCVMNLWFSVGVGVYSSPLDKMTIIFMNEKFCFLIEISLNFVSEGPIENNPALV